MAAQRETILRSALRHGIAPDVLGAVLYNEMLGQETRFLSVLVPGDNAVAETLRDGLLGWHFLTLKQAQWLIKGSAALAGFNTTVGPTGIRVSVGREIRSEIPVSGGEYRAQGWLERPSMVADLVNTSTAIEYLAANLERAKLRSPAAAAGDWTIDARWHNTGLTADRPDVPRAVWDKGTRYIARVQQFLPEVSAILDGPPGLSIERVLQHGVNAAAVSADHAQSVALRRGPE